jgi:hypothetical protein
MRKHNPLPIFGVLLVLATGSPAKGAGPVVEWGLFDYYYGGVSAPYRVNGTAGLATAIARGSGEAFASFSCAIQAGTDAVICWLPSVTWFQEPREIPVPDSVNGTSGTASAIAAGLYHSCAIQAGTDAVICWNPRGEPQEVPDSVNGTSGTASAIAGSRYHDLRGPEDTACAIQAETGAIVCWGDDSYGQATPPPEVNGATGTASAVAVGPFSACAIQSGTGAVVCWGEGPFGPIVPPAVPATALALGSGYCGGMVGVCPDLCVIEAATSAVVCSDSEPPQGTALAIAAGGVGFLAVQALKPGYCPEAPTPGCIAASKAKLEINERSVLYDPGWPNDPYRRPRVRIEAKLQSFEPMDGAVDFGNPVSGMTAYGLCIYGEDELLRWALHVDRAGATCDRKPCWKTKKGGYKYRDPRRTSSDVGKLTLRVGTGKVAVNARWWGRYGITDGLATTARVKVQLLTSDAACVEATLNSVKARNHEFKAKAP